MPIDNEEAIIVLDAADRLYSGELFEDLSADIVEDDNENWVLPKRIWLKDMALKVLRDRAEILRQRGQFRDALESCHKALELDPTCEIAHAEAMKIFHAQNRSEAITRQYHQFVGAMDAMGLQAETQDLERLWSSLTKDLI